MRKTFVGMWVCLWLVNTALGQTSSSAASSPSVSDSTQQAAVQTYQQEQIALAQEENALMAQGATRQQLEAWRLKNVTRIAKQQERAAAMAAASAAQPMPLMAPNIPANASPAMRDYLTTQAALVNAQAQIHNQLVQALPSPPSDAQISQMHQQEMQLFQQQHASDLQLQAQRAQALAEEEGRISMPMPPPLQMPPNATPQMQVYLTLRDQLMREQIQLYNQHLTDNQQTKTAAIQQWQQTNAARFQQLQQLAITVTSTTATTPGGSSQ